MSKEGIKKLRWLRLMTTDHLPRYLVDQIKNKDYTTDDFFKYQDANLLLSGEDGPHFNPYHHLHALLDESNFTMGFVWFIIDPLTKDICIMTYSVDKEYWGGGRAVEKLADYIKDIRRKAKLNKIYWITNHPVHSEKHGFKRSKSVLMEYTDSEG